MTDVMHMFFSMLDMELNRLLVKTVNMVICSELQGPIHILLLFLFLLS